MEEEERDGGVGIDLPYWHICTQLVGDAKHQSRNPRGGRRLSRKQCSSSPQIGNRLNNRLYQNLWAVKDYAGYDGVWTPCKSGAQELKGVTPLSLHCVPGGCVVQTSSSE